MINNKNKWEGVKQNPDKCNFNITIILSISIAVLYLLVKTHVYSQFNKKEIWKNKLYLNKINRKERCSTYMRSS